MKSHPRVASWLMVLSLVPPLAAQEDAARTGRGPFVALGLEQALQRDGLVVLAFRSPSCACAPCMLMEQLTWRDRGLLSWMEEHATAVEVDVDADPAAAEAWSVHEVPTLLVLRDGDERARLAGMQLPAQVRACLRAVLDGGTYPPPADTEDDLLALARDGLLMTQATQALVSGRLDTCRRLCSFAWRRGREFESRERTSPDPVLLMMLGQLVQWHEPAREEFLQLLVELEVEVRSGADDLRLWRDWFALARALGEQRRACAALEAVREARGAFHDDPELGDAAHAFLWEAGEHALAGRIAGDLAGLAEHVLLGSIEEYEEHPDLHVQQRGARRAARYYASALCAGREDVAKRIASHALASFGHEQVRLLLVEEALVAGQPRKEHLQWLAEPAARGSEVARHRAGLMRRWIQRHEEVDPPPPFAPPWRFEAGIPFAGR